MKMKSAKSSRRGLKASDNRPLNPIDPTFSLADRLSLEPELRTLELIYSLRRYLCMARDGEWVDVLRELISLGKASVPELIAELDQTDEIEHLNALGFILCQINDPRCVSALIRVITRPRKSREQSNSGETSQDRI